MFSLLVTAVLAQVPYEYVVDCSTVEHAVKVKNVIALRFEALDGRTIETEMGLNPVLTGKAVALTITSLLDDCGWRYERIGDGVLVIRGSKASPIKDVTFKGGMWVPAVTRRLATQPPPRDPKK